MTNAIVIVSYNSAFFLRKNLLSVQNQTLPFDQIIVVDNGSHDKSKEILHEFPQVIKICLPYNSGYARGANIGISQATTDLVMVANADIFLKSDFLEKINERFCQDDDLDMISPLILRFDGKTVDSAGQTYSKALYPKEIGYNRARDQINLREREVFSICGAATVFHRRALDRLKQNGQWYDEDFFIFWEDFDIGWRADRLGLKKIFFPEAVIYHYRSGTMKKSFLSRFSLSLTRPAQIKFHLVKNRYLTLIKNFSISDFAWTIPFILIKDIIWVGMLTFSAPKIIILLWGSRELFSTALKKRIK